MNIFSLFLLALPLAQGLDFDAFAMCGGAHLAQGMNWGALIALEQYNGQTSLQELVGEKVISSNSGGNWFVTSMKFDKRTIESFNNPDKDSFIESVYKPWINEILSKHEEGEFVTDGNQIPDGYDTLKSICVLSGAVEILDVACRAGSILSEDGWDQYLKSIHDIYEKNIQGSPFFSWTQQVLINREGFQKKEIIDGFLKYTGNYQILKNKDDTTDNYEQHSSGLALFLDFEFTKDGGWKVSPSVPECDSEVCLIKTFLKEAKKFSNVFQNDYMKNEKTENLNTAIIYDDMKDKLGSNENDDFKYLGSPGSHVLGFMTNYAFLYHAVPIPVGKEESIEDVTEEFVKTPMLFGKENQIVSVADGGHMDNTAIIGAVHRLQEKFPNTEETKTILAVTATMFWELCGIFQTKNGCGSGIDKWMVEPKIFDTDISQYVTELSDSNKYVRVKIYATKTVENPKVGIVGGMKIHLVVIHPREECTKSLNIFLLDTTSETHISCTQNVMNGFYEVLPKVEQELQYIESDENSKVTLSM